MPKVHPNAAVPQAGGPGAAAAEEPAAVLTVWRKSLLLNCEGFTVFDAKGDLAFRVDSYGSGRRTEVVLMDVAGKPLLTVRRKICWCVVIEAKLGRAMDHLRRRRRRRGEAAPVCAPPRQPARVQGGGVRDRGYPRRARRSGGLRGGGLVRPAELRRARRARRRRGRGPAEGVRRRRRVPPRRGAAPRRVARDGPRHRARRDFRRRRANRPVAAAAQLVGGVRRPTWHIRRSRWASSSRSTRFSAAARQPAGRRGRAAGRLREAADVASQALRHDTSTSLRYTSLRSYGYEKSCGPYLSSAHSLRGSFGI